MKVAVNGWFCDSTPTGSGQYVRNMLTALQQADASLTLEVVEPRTRNDTGKVWFEQRVFPSAARRMKANLAFVPYWGPPLASPVPVVCTIHDVIPLILPAYRGKARHRIYTSLVRAASASCAHIITDSEHSRNDICRWLPVRAENVTAVPLAASPVFTPNVDERVRAELTARYNLPERFALYVGGFDARKNIETMLQMWTWAGDTIGHETQFVIAGSPDEKVHTINGSVTPLETLVKALDLEDVVRMIGKLNEQDKPGVMAMARCFLFASTYEGFGLPPLEAMACGVPVVGSNASSLPEVIGNAGMLMEPMNARQMAGSMILICTDDEMHAKMAQRALLRAAQFTWARTALETLAVFRRVAK